MVGVAQRLRRQHFCSGCWQAARGTCPEEDQRLDMLSPTRSTRPPRERKSLPHGRDKRRRFDALHRIVEDDLIRRVSYAEYRAKVKDVYSGPQGAMLAACSFLSLHLPLGERIFRTRKFDLRGMKSILDLGRGAGQLAKHLIR